MTKRALIIGSTGLVAPALSAKMRDLGWQTLHTSRSGAAEIRFDLARPDLSALPGDIDVVFLIAAETSLRRCEDEPVRTERINVLAPAEIARHYSSDGAHVLTLSTNLVFDGAVPRVSPDAERRPACAYGKQKARLENVLMELPASATVLRITKIAESLQSLMTEWSRDLKAGKPIKSFSDLVCAPVSLSRVVDVLGYAAHHRLSGTFQHSGDRDIDYVEIARALCHARNLPEVLVQPCRGADLPRPPVALPANTTLAETLPSGFSPQGPEDVSAVLAGFFDRQKTD